MKYNKILVVTDNHFLFKEFRSIIQKSKFPEETFQFCCTSVKTQIEKENLKKINLKKDYERLINEYDLIISLHCKQIFPEALVNSVRCINIHPGFNPYNRGWYPQIFSILNKLPVGATIHQMDELIDHGKIIVQKKVQINPWDTSLDVYNKVLHAELELINENLEKILNDEMQGSTPHIDGNYNSVKDFENLLLIDLNEHIKVIDFIDRLRALTHGNLDNAYFIDPVSNKKVFVKISLKVGDE